MQYKLNINAATVCLILSYLPFLKSSCTHHVAAGMDPGTNGSFQHYICTSGLLESDTELILGDGDHIINSSESCVMMDINNINITSVGKAHVLCSSALQGHNFVFLNIKNLFLENIVMDGCGRVSPADLPSYVNDTFTYISAQQKVVFLLSRVSNLRLINVDFLRSYGFSIIAVNLRGNTELSHVEIAHTNNSRHADCYDKVTDLSCSGSGAAFVYSQYTDIDGSAPNDASFIIADSTIINNENSVPNDAFLPTYVSLRSGYQAENILLTGASGLAFYLGQMNYKVDVNIVSSNLSNNSGYGSTIAFLLLNSIRENRIEISGCTMEYNKGYSLSRGGAILIFASIYFPDLQSFPKYPDDIFRIIVVRNTSFIRNTAPIGGALYFYFGPQNVSNYGITFDNVTFRENVAEMSSSAFEVSTRQSTIVQKQIHLLMRDVIATRNALLNCLNTSFTNVANSAAFVFSELFNITVSGSNHTHKSVFSYHIPGVFLILGGNLYLQGYVEFIKNTAVKGGALSMYDYSLLFFHEGARVNFTNNSATEVGGAIYASSLATGFPPTCVFQVIGTTRVNHSSDVSLLDLKLRFTNNTALNGGNSIYANPLYVCSYLPESSLVDRSVFVNSSQVFNSIYTFQDSSKNGLHELSSLPEYVCSCSEGVVRSSSIACKLTTKVTMAVFPGQIFLVHAFSADFNYSPVSSIVFARQDSLVHTLGNGQGTHQLSGTKCTRLEFTIFGAEKTNTSLSLSTRLGGASLIFGLNLKECPPGFVLTDGDKKACECDPHVTNTLKSSCNLTDYTISRRPNSWLGVVEHPNISNVVYVETCPSGFCVEDINSVNLREQDQLCTKGRTGILCGACKGNLSVVFGSPHCMECSNVWLLTILLYAVAGIVMLAVLFFLQFTVSHGTIYVIIFYANILSVDSNIIFPTSNRGFLFIWISLMNLELGFPVCFYDGMNEAAKAGLQAIFPMYLLLISIFIIFLSEKSHIVAKLTSSHGIQLLATIVYLSFSKMLRYVIDILTLSILRIEEGTHTIWFYDGNQKYFTGGHVIIAIIPALFTLIFIAIYSLAMLFIKQIEKRSNKFKPFMDAYAGPYKDKYRFWFGLRLFVLAAICMTYVVLGADDPVTALTIQLLFVFLFVLLHAYIKPYRNEWINGTDIIFMIYFILLILFIIRAYRIEGDNSRERITPIVVIVLVGMAFIHFAVIIFVHFLKALYRIPIIRTRTKPLITELKKTSILATFQVVGASMPFRRTAAPEVTNKAELTSMSSENTVFTNVSAPVSSTVVSLDTVLSAEERRMTFSHLRESLIEP